MFTKKVVLSQSALKFPNAIQEALEAISRKGVTIKDCTFETRRDWSTVGGGEKYYETNFKGHFVLKGEEVVQEVSAEILESYKHSIELGRTAKITLGETYYQIRWDAPNDPKVVFKSYPLPQS